MQISFQLKGCMCVIMHVFINGADGITQQRAVGGNEKTVR